MDLCVKIKPNTGCSLLPEANKVDGGQDVGHSNALKLTPNDVIELRNDFHVKKSVLRLRHIKAVEGHAFDGVRFARLGAQVDLALKKQPMILEDTVLAELLSERPIADKIKAYKVRRAFMGSCVVIVNQYNKYNGLGQLINTLEGLKAQPCDIVKEAVSGYTEGSIFQVIHKYANDNPDVDVHNWIHVALSTLRIAQRGVELPAISFDWVTTHDQMVTTIKRIVGCMKELAALLFSQVNELAVNSDLSENELCEFLRDLQYMYKCSEIPVVKLYDLLMTLGIDLVERNVVTARNFLQEVYSATHNSLMNLKGQEKFSFNDLSFQLSTKLSIGVPLQ